MLFVLLEVAIILILLADYDILRNFTLKEYTSPTFDVSRLHSYQSVDFVHLHRVYASVSQWGGWRPQ